MNVGDLGEGEISKSVCTVLITQGWSVAAKENEADRQFERVKVNYKDEQAIRVV